MNNTSAALVIIQPLWPGPGTLKVPALKSLGRLPSLSLCALNAMDGSVFWKYASIASNRSLSVGPAAAVGAAAAAGAGAGAGVCARNDPTPSTPAKVNNKNNF